jgi:hypothetical protein
MTSTPVNGNVETAVIVTKGASTYVTVSSITQTGVTWTQLTPPKQGFTKRQVNTWIGVVGAGASTSVIINVSGTFDSGQGGVANICEYSGMATSSELDKTANNSGSGTLTDTGTTPTTTQASELWIGGTWADAQAQSSPTNGFTHLDGVKGSDWSADYLEKIVSATGAADSGTTVGGSTDWLGQIVCLFSSSGATQNISEIASQAGASAIANITQVASCLLSWVATIPLAQIGSQLFSYVATIPLTQTATESSTPATVSLTQISPEGFSYVVTIPLTQTGSETNASATQNLTQTSSIATVVSNITFSLSQISGESLTANLTGAVVNVTETGLETSFTANVSLPLAEVASETSSITNISFPLLEIAAETAQTGLFVNITQLASTSLSWMATIPLIEAASQLFSYSATIPLIEGSVQNEKVTNILVPLYQTATENGYSAAFSITEWAIESPSAALLIVVAAKAVKLIGANNTLTLVGTSQGITLVGNKGSITLD